MHRAIVWQDRRTAARCQELAPRAEWIAARTGLRARSVLLGDEDRVAAAMTSDCSSATGAASWPSARSTAGSSGSSPAAPSTRPIRRTRRARCCTTSTRCSGATSCARCSACRRRCCPRCARRAATSASTTRDVLGADAADPRHRGRSAGGAVRTGLLDRRGSGKNTYGTGAFLLLNAGDRASRGGRGGLLTTIACDARGGPVYALEAAIFIAGAAVQWLRDGLGIIESRARPRRWRGRSSRPMACTSFRR